MNNSNLQARIVDLDYQETIPLKEIEQKVFSGSPVVISQCLQGIGFYEKIKQASLEGISQAVGKEKAAQINERGFAAFHEIVTLDELPEVSDRTYQTIHAITPELSRAIVGRVFQQKRPFYCEEYPNVRFHVPYDVVVQQKSKFGQFYWNGKVTAHGPHHDSWYQCPVNCVNIWIAIGPVKIGNGLNIYPEAYGKRLPCNEDGKILRDQYCGSKISFDLNPGDALIFHGEHLHSSEINSTEATRYVISLRMTLDTPKYLDRSPYRNNYIYTHPQNNFGAKLSETVAGVSRRIAKKIDSILVKPEDQNYVISDLTGTVFNDTSGAIPQQIEGINDTATKDKLTFAAEDLPVGAVKPISEKMCVTRLDSDRVVAFSRHCSHEGADLAGGEIKDGKIFCPWHNLAFDLENGASPCQALPKLKVIESSIESDHIKISH